MVTLILLSVFATSMVSGVFGMAGGMILLGIYAALLPVPLAMALHGATQLSSNGFRALLLRKSFDGRSLSWYVGGALASFAAFSVFAWTVDKAALYLILGSMPYVFRLAPKMPRLDFCAPRHALACGVSVTAMQLTAGVSGPLLDVFFVDSGLSRFQVVCAKSFTQCLGHFLKIIYFAGVVRGGGETSLSPVLYGAVCAAAAGGTMAGKKLLERMEDGRFRTLSGRLMLVVGAVYIWKGFCALGGG